MPTLPLLRRGWAALRWADVRVLRRLTVQQLPSCAYHLNPAEGLWSVLRRTSVANRAFIRTDHRRHRGAPRTARDALRHPEPNRVPFLRAEAVRAVRSQVPLPFQSVGATAAVQPGQ